MSLKFGLTIGAIWTGAAAFTASEKALNALKNRVLQLNQKKLNLKGDSRGFPACAGIDPARLGGTIAKQRFPRIRGDRSSFPAAARTAEAVSPHARG